MKLSSNFIVFNINSLLILSGNSQSGEIEERKNYQKYNELISLYFRYHETKLLMKLSPLWAPNLKSQSLGPYKVDIRRVFISKHYCEDLKIDTY